MTVDEQRDILPADCRSCRQLLGRRPPGQQSVRELDGRCRCRDGQVQWHFQTVHHDLWDSDMPSPTLVDIRHGRTIPALASVGKTGYVFILDRVTGKPIFAEERPIPRATFRASGIRRRSHFREAAAPDARRVQEGGDRRDASADHVKACQELWDERQLLQRRTVHALHVSRRRSTAK
jgi:hypothetical protein